MYTRYVNKGLTPVVATVLLMAITVGAVGTLYATAQGLEQDASDNTEDFTLTSNSLQIERCWAERFLHENDTLIYVRNTDEDSALNVSELTVAYNGVEEKAMTDKMILDSQEAAKLRLEGVGDFTRPGFVEIFLDEERKTHSCSNLYSRVEDKRISGAIGYYPLDTLSFNDLNSSNHADSNNIEIISTERGSAAEFNPTCPSADEDDCFSSAASWNEAEGNVPTDGTSENYSFSISDPFSLSAWVKPVVGKTDRSTYFLGRGHTVQSYGLYLNPGGPTNPGRIGAGMRDWDGSSDSVSAFVSESIDEFKFYHSVMVYKPSDREVELYIDGELVGVVSNTDLGEDSRFLQPTREDLLGGKGRPGGTGEGSPGFGEVLTDALIFNKSLSKEEVRTLYERQK